ncbi:MAG: hypothetical protein LBW77_06820 [Verrucomicrobiota bacterium]|jgi:hypothetical protein|nr:hypothetical protein [Verrucomicrobiota bacterium]
MAVTAFQSYLLRLLAGTRRERGDSYVAGGVALNILLDGARRSRDIDLFHDSETALAASWQADRERLLADGSGVRVFREAPSFVEAVVTKGAERTVLQWARDSVFRFFPLMEDALMGLTLHPFDLATNKVLAMAGRLEVRDWVDLLACDERLQPLGLLVWAACGKDPGYNPFSLLAEVGRHHYSHAETALLDYEGEPPDAAALNRKWHGSLADADAFCRLLPADQVGTCVLACDRTLFRGTVGELEKEVSLNSILFHEGCLAGAWPSARQLNGV